MATAALSITIQLAAKGEIAAMTSSELSDSLASRLWLENCSNVVVICHQRLHAKRKVQFL